MSIEELFAGVGVVIDDKVYSSDEHDDLIVTIVKQLENEKHFPLVKHDNFPSEQELHKMDNVSFLLLDWEIDTRENVLGEDGLSIPMPDALKESNKKVVIGIVRAFLENNMAPVFIFSNLDTDTIKKELKKEKIDIDNSPVFVESKFHLVENGKLFERIEEWVNSVSGVYVAKVWEKAFNKAKNQFFAEMANKSSHWPKALFYSASEDNVSPGEEITQAVSQNIISRMLPININQDQIDKDTTAQTREEVLEIMKGQFFAEPASGASIVGDFYVLKEEGHDVKYFINIRPTCDCVERDGNDGFIYLLECTQVTGKKTAELYNQNDGHFNETIGCAIVGPLYKNRIYHINFKSIRIEPYLNWSDKKKGRILPPIINHITERYSLYVQRQALPRIPKEIVPGLQDGANHEDPVEQDIEKKQGCLTAILGLIGIK